MKDFLRSPATFCTLLLQILMGISASAQQDSLLSVLEKELQREFTELKKAQVPAYYIDYHVDDIEYASLNASFGSLTQAAVSKNRVLAARVRVGDYSFDNMHPMSADEGNFLPGGGFGPVMLPYENNAKALQFMLWKATQNEYKQAVDAYKAIKNASERRAKPGTPINDFSKEEPTLSVDPKTIEFASIFNQPSWEEKIKKYSSPFLKNPDLIEGDVTLTVSVGRKYFVSSEGTRIVQNFTSAYINVSASVRASDGDIAPLHLSYYAPLPAGLPADEAIITDVEAMVGVLKKLKDAPLAEPYSGPAILYAPTAGVFFHEIFGHRIEGHRLKNEFDGQTFKAKVGEEVLPKTLNVHFDPTLEKVDGRFVNGSYKYDDEGISSKKVTLVEKGVLKT
ncbi:MAG TPA: metallopeptidase TldD-related protein, partial [Chryseolinea sp.]|nr:metallopeptidase TldD-related protein [Chryseolinea sp.]